MDCGEKKVEDLYRINNISRVPVIIIPPRIIPYLLRVIILLYIYNTLRVWTIRTPVSEEICYGMRFNRRYLRSAKRNSRRKTGSARAQKRMQNNIIFCLKKCSRNVFVRFDTCTLLLSLCAHARVLPINILLNCEFFKFSTDFQFKMLKKFVNSRRDFCFLSFYESQSDSKPFFSFQF